MSLLRATGIYGPSKQRLKTMPILTFIRAPKAATKRIFFVTDEDNPHEGNFQLDRIAKQNITVSLGESRFPRQRPLIGSLLSRDHPRTVLHQRRKQTIRLYQALR